VEMQCHKEHLKSGCVGILAEECKEAAFYRVCTAAISYQKKSNLVFDDPLD